MLSVGVFSWCVLLGFSGFWHGTRNPCHVVCDRAGFFGKLLFAQKIRKMAKKVVFEFEENVGH